MKKILFAAIASLCLLAVCARADDKVTLKFNFKKGDVNGMKLVMEQNISQDIQGQKVEVKQTIGYGFTGEVTDVSADGIATVKITYKQLIYKMKGPGGEIAYDSDDTTAKPHPAAMGFAALKGKTFSMKMNAIGGVTAIEGLDTMMQAVMKELPDGAMRDAMAASLKEQFGDESIKQSMQQMLMTYPDHPVGPGDSWSGQTAMRGMKLDNKFTFTGRKDGIVSLDLNSAITSDPKAPPTNAGAFKARLTVAGTQKGKMEVSEATGWPVRGSFKQKIEGKIKMISGDANADDPEWPITIETTGTVEPFAAK